MSLLEMHTIAQVLDEADRLLDFPELPRILETVNKKRQTLLFSATVTSACHRRPSSALACPGVPYGTPRVPWSALEYLDASLLHTSSRQFAAPWPMPICVCPAAAANATRRSSYCPL